MGSFRREFCVQEDPDDPFRLYFVKYGRLAENHRVDDHTGLSVRFVCDSRHMENSCENASRAAESFSSQI